ncbi:MAG: adenylosuccinate synthetase [Candidatus Levybacteria bacterium]|nr:adenylosuccinate synthetase [Candidatus Levybacteria bacterium]
MPRTIRKQKILPSIQEQRFLDPHRSVNQDYNAVYKKSAITIGWPKGKKRLFSHTARPNTAAIVGVALGDEGKGRLVDNKIESLLKNKKIKHVTVIRYQGGNNAGHTVEKGNIKLALHLVPSSVMYEKAAGIMDRGMVINIEDLQTEVSYIEKSVESIAGRLFLSDDAILCTDLERAEEVVNRLKDARAEGGTGRGIAPSYAHHYDRIGLHIFDIMSDNWRDRLATQYERYEKEFRAFDRDLKNIEVPDFQATVRNKEATKRTVGSKKIFLERFALARSWLLKRKFVTNTFPLHRTLSLDTTAGIIFEGAQAAGLDAWNGTRPDVTTSNTTIYGVREGTAFWRLQDISERIGVFKITYTSSVGARRMPTHVTLPKDLNDLPKNASKDEKWAAYVREEAHEYGTTTGRPRDITFLDLAFLSYNARMAGVEVLIGTHLDIAQENQTINVCTDYVDKKGKYIPYQPGIRYLTNVVPHYITLPGWNAANCRSATSLMQLPTTAQQFLSFIQTRLGYPIVAATTGTKRENILEFDGYTL